MEKGYPFVIDRLGKHLAYSRNEATVKIYIIHCSRVLWKNDDANIITGIILDVTYSRFTVYHCINVHHIHNVHL